MNILGIESSCDDTALSIVQNATHVCAHVTHSQITNHAHYGGVVPELAARLHELHIIPLFEELLSVSQMRMHDIDAIAVTVGPGLQTSLLTGTTVGSFLSLLLQKPIIPIHHVYGHIVSPLLDRSFDDFEFPSLTLTVSGGHTHLYRVSHWHKVECIGYTLDDAAGEAFDKCAKMLGLSYPGGPIVSQYAEKGDPNAFSFPIILLEKESLNFSFSGLKAAVYRLLESETTPFSEQFKADVCASFQSCVAQTFLKKLDRSFQQFPDTKALHFVGGVSANTYIRSVFQQWCKERGIQFFMPHKFLYSTDNAAMIASAGYLWAQKKENNQNVSFVDANPRFDLQSFMAQMHS